MGRILEQGEGFGANTGSKLTSRSGISRVVLAKMCQKDNAQRNTAIHGAFVRAFNKSNEPL